MNLRDFTVKNWIVIISVLAGLFSILELYNLAALWKDQVEFELYHAQSFKQSEVVNLVDRSVELTWYQGLFSLLLLLSLFVLIRALFPKKLFQKKDRG